MCEPRRHAWGNFTDYYRIRNPTAPEDPRLEVLLGKMSWEGKHVLDLGCNSGELSIGLATKGGCASVAGVDIDTDLVATAQAAAENCIEASMAAAKESGAVGTAAARLQSQALRFISHDMLQLRFRPRSFDAVLLLSTTKWLHLQYGDEGIREQFKRCFRWLRPGGLFVLEPQPWKAYKKVADAHADAEKIWRSIVLRPSDFPFYLTQDVGFCEEYEWVAMDHAQDSFRRTLFFFWKPAGQPKTSSSRKRRSHGRVYSRRFGTKRDRRLRLRRLAAATRVTETPLGRTRAPSAASVGEGSDCQRQRRLRRRYSGRLSVFDGT
eukprot:TRINITY_DN37831_c0_g1_i1.p1 TRINITY_DN37831_c0_g1~~TRINITY_DN37831_c0_g1_i1.p1  ORF type:complete len:322 (-),score=37.17 TRINITY_DN37831_c0_g1_i1:105-1070(-)